MLCILQLTYRMRIAFKASLLALAFSSGCAWNTSGSKVGVLYQSTAENISITGKPVRESSGTGVACSVSYFGLVHIGDASVVAAMKSAGITEVLIVDRTSDNILGIWGRRCTVVRGN